MGVKGKRLAVLTCLPGLVLVFLLACGPRATPASSPTTTVRPTSKATVSPKPGPTSQPATMPSSVSFAGKTVTFVVPYAPGGSADPVARLYADYLGRLLPGKPTTVVRNMPGGGATIGANYAYAAKPDGLTLLMTAGSVLNNNAMMVKAAKYRLMEMPLVIAAPTITIIFMRIGIIDKPENLLKAKGIVYGTLPTSPSGWQFLFAKDLLGIPTEKVAAAYPGTGDVIRGFLVGEINVGSAALPAYLPSIAPLVAKGEVMPLWQTGLLDEKGNNIRDPGFPGIYTFGELYKAIRDEAPSGMAWEAHKTINDTQVYQNALFLAPGTPDNITRTYWAAAETMMKDPAFIKSAKTLVGETAIWQVGEALDRSFKQSFKTDPKVVQWIKETLANKYQIVVE